MRSTCQCGEAITGYEAKRGRCAQCEVDSWSPERRRAIGRMVSKAFGVAFKGEDEKGLDDLVQEALDA